MTNTTRDPRGRKPTCLCGDCHKCNSREATRLYMRDYNQGIRRPRVLQWRPEEDALIGKGQDRIVAIVLQRTVSSVANRRDQLGRAAHKRLRKPTTDAGYKLVILDKHDPLVEMTRGPSRYVLEHRLVMARHLDRPLTRDEFVHHRNGIRTDNRIENLELWTRSHPDGQRVEDVLDWCVSFIERYAHQAIFLSGDSA